MKTALGLSLLAVAGSANAHCTVWSVWVNGQDQGDGRNSYIRSPPNNYPVKDVTQPAIACNVNGGQAVPQFVQVAAGDQIEFEWYHDTRGDDIIAASHHGPISTYIAPYESGDASGPIWTKLAEEGLDHASTTWAVDRLIQNRGRWPVTLPSSLAPGQYLLRQEIIALHEADAVYTENPVRGAQFYPSCVQIEVTSGGSASPPDGFDFNDYDVRDPGIHFNLYQCPPTGSYGCFGEYSVPGPAVWSG